MNKIVLENLCRLRSENLFNAFSDNTNRHKIVVKDGEGTTAYYFSAPFRSEEDEIVIAEFHDKDRAQFMYGTSCSVTVKDIIKIRNENTEVNIDIPKSHEWYRVGRDILCGNTRISPTLNGISIRSPIACGDSVDVIVTTENMFGELKCNSKYFAFMEQKFVPSFTVSPIGVRSGDRIGALLLSVYPGKAAGEYRLSFSAPDIGGEMCAEFNMYEQKLIQDTTVESARPNENNAYGTTAFVGHSDTFGAQQLYLKFNYPMIDDFGREPISSIKLYLPVLGGDMPTLEALHMDSRFCSFGSVWNKRIKPSEKRLPVKYHNGFCCIDLSNAMIDAFGRLKFSNGFHLRTYGDAIGYCALATGDSHLFPSIFEVRWTENQK